MSALTNIKDPDEVLDYGLDLVDWLPDGDSIDSDVWTPDNGITKESEMTNGTQTAIMVSGGTVGTTYALKGVVTTAEGRVLVRRIRVYVQER